MNFSRCARFACGALMLLAAVRSFAAEATFDPAFGNQGLLMLHGYEAVPLPDGRFLHAVLANGRLTVTRYDQNGQPDPSFGAAGQVETQVAESVSTGLRLGYPGRDGYTYWNTYRNDGMLLVSERSQIVSQVESQLMRIGPDGKPDPSFGDHGVVRFPYTGIPDAHESWIDRVVTAADGHVYVLVDYQFDAYDDTVAVRLYRLNPGGQLDTNFGTGGAYEVPHDGFAYWYPQQLVALGDRLLVVWPAGAEESAWPSGKVAILDRYGIEVHVPEAFSASLAGLDSTSYEDQLRGRNLEDVVATDQNVYVAYTTNDSTPRIIVSRWHTDLTPDTSFGADSTGTVELAFPAPVMTSGIFQLVPPGAVDDHVYVVFNQFLIRLLANGMPDASYGDSGILGTNLNYMRVINSQSAGLVTSISEGIVRLADSPAPFPGLIRMSLLYCNSPIQLDDTPGKFVISVSRLGGRAGQVKIHYATEADTAVPGVDYIDTSGILSWEDGASDTQTIEVKALQPTYPSMGMVYPAFRINLEVVDGNPLLPCDTGHIEIRHMGSAAGAGGGNSGDGAQPATGGGSSGGVSSDTGGGSVDSMSVGLLMVLLSLSLRRRRLPPGRAVPDGQVRAGP